MTEPSTLATMVDPEPVSEEERKRRLARNIQAQVLRGWRVESQDDYSAVLVKGHRPNHLLHLILTLVTLGLWAIVWILVVAIGGEKRMVVHGR
jgi:hypothetical protein